LPAIAELPFVTRNGHPKGAEVIVLVSGLVANGPRHPIFQFRKTLIAYPLVTSAKRVIRPRGVALSQGIRYAVRELGPASRTMVMVPAGLGARPS